MIALALLTLAQGTVPTHRYELCGQAVNSVAELRENVNKSARFTAVPNSGTWHARTDGQDIVWLFPDKQSAMDIAICRHIEATSDGTSMQTDLICDGSDSLCDAARDQLLGQAAVGGRTRK